MEASTQQQQQATVTPAQPAANGSGKSACPPHVLAAIYGKKTQEEKKAELDASLHRWWVEYAERKNDEEHEYVANSLLYDRNHLPRTAPAPDCVLRAEPAQQQQQQQQQPPPGPTA